ncbi:MAG: UDP-3-O-(3-hydroxymyristoyl)glucosamine N-acyltransferase [Lutibacter sp.]|nr:UDP-3-O-(3-hydroxymyristoyl)glucosamine N-acyltransferase [Lutibacter sp.]
MNFTANQIASILDGTIEGDEGVEVSKLSKIEEGEKGSLTFLSNTKYTPYIYTTNASIVIVDADFSADKDISATLIRVPDAYKAFSTLLSFYDQQKLMKSGIETPSFISDSAVLGDQLYLGAFSYINDQVSLGNNVKIYPNVYIGKNVQIGDNTVIYAGVKIYADTIIGKDCFVHAGAVIGSDGFGFAPDEHSVYSKIPQIGNVIIEDCVDIGAATTIDRATLGSTIIRKGVKLDNQIQVAHNVEIGENTVIAAQTGIAGSTKIGKHCVIGGQVGIAGHITVGNYVKVQAQTGIARNVKDNEKVQGTPAISYSAYNKSYIYFKRLPELVSKIDLLEKELHAIKNK